MACEYKARLTDDVRAVTFEQFDSLGLVLHSSSLRTRLDYVLTLIVPAARVVVHRGLDEFISNHAVSTVVRGTRKIKVRGYLPAIYPKVIATTHLWTN